MVPKADVGKLTAELRRFAKERDWDQFHSPKNLAAALSVEAGEVLEHFQWLTEAQSRKLPPDKRAQIELELADVLLYLLRLAGGTTTVSWDDPVPPRGARMAIRAGDSSAADGDSARW